MNKKTIVFFFALFLFLSIFNSNSWAESYKPRYLSEQRYSVMNNYRWEQVVDLGFGNPNNLHAWSMKKYKDFIYVGTRNVIDGCQIYRSNTDFSDISLLSPFLTTSNNYIVDYNLPLKFYFQSIV